MAADYETGQKMIRDRSFEDNAEYFATVFEIGRRHKILNPECMRTGTMCIQFCAPPPPFFLVATAPGLGILAVPATATNLNNFHSTNLPYVLISEFNMYR